MEKYISINEIARIKGLNSNRSIRLAIQKGKYIAREVEVRGGKSYEILYSSLEARQKFKKNLKMKKSEEHLLFQF